MSISGRIVGRLARLRPPETRDVAVDRDLPMLAEAGVTLLADHWYPAGDDLTLRPIVLLRTPYGRRPMAPVARAFAERGYQVVVQSCRGTFGSGGTWDPFHHERADGLACHAWMAGQRWWSGRVGTFGPSYLGLTQWSVAVDPPVGLVAMAPNVTATDFRDVVVYPGGSFTLETGAAWLWQLAHQELGWKALVRAHLSARRRLAPALTTLPLAEADTAALGAPVAYYQDWLVHDRPDDDWWSAVDFSADLSQAPPSSHVAGWYDIFLPAQLADHQAQLAAGGQSRLTVGPWTHTSGRGALAALADGVDWMDRHLLGRDPGPSPAVRVNVIGRDRWVDLPSWPPPADLQTWHLQPGVDRHGSLSREPAPAGRPPTRYRYDPADPTPGIGGPSLSPFNAGSRDQARREARPDVAVWTTPPARRAWTVAGPLTATLWVRTSGPHFDVSVRLCLVDRRGRSRNVSEGILRVEDDGAGGLTTPAHPMWGAVSVEADGTARVEVHLWPTCLGIGPGRRLRLQVAGGAHPLFARNLGGGEPLGRGRSMTPVDVEVLHDPDHPSRVDLPVCEL